MAKGQKRSTREAKKPKQDKPKKPAASASQFTSVFHKPAPAKGRTPGKS